jgi:RNA polymerase sigma-70 factor (ECF subfamily)
MALAWIVGMPLSAVHEHQSAEARLVAASRNGDPDAFAELVHLHQRRVFRLVGRFFRRAEDVEDAAQETFLTAWRKLSTYRAEAPFEHWLTRVCLNCCYGRLRKQKPGDEAALPLEVEPAVEGADPGASLEVERLLRPLPAADRFILLLLYGEGWTVAEIAKRLGWTPVNVKVRAHRARKKLRRLLETDLDRGSDGVS